MPLSPEVAHGARRILLYLEVDMIKAKNKKREITSQAIRSLR
jgi:hypothetical protein